MPFIKVQNPTNDKAWINNKIKKLMTARNKAAAQNNNTLIKQLHKQIQREIRYNKRRHAKQTENSLKQNPAKAWKSLAGMLHLSTKPSDCSMPADELNKFYNRFDQMSAEFSTPTLPQVDLSMKDFLDPDSIRQTLKQLSTRKACGPDGITGKVLKVCADNLYFPLAKLFNKAIQFGTFPDTWKLTTIKPVPKKPGATEAKDHRPIALTSTISKVFEKQIVQVLSKAIKDDYQFAYR